MYHVVILMEEGEGTVKVDKQGRMVLPSRLRESLGVKKGGRVSIRLEGSKAVIEPRTKENIEERIKNWVKITLDTKAQVFTERNHEKNMKRTGWKWMSLEYARRKLGLH
jgi:AbrB family looped-hinge helix DNA binding protein